MRKTNQGYEYTSSISHYDIRSIAFIQFCKCLQDSIGTIEKMEYKNIAGDKKYKKLQP